MPDTTNAPGNALVPTGVITVCCGIHQPGGWGSCCAVDDCAPQCCERCPNCPAVAIEAGIADVRAATTAVMRNLP